MDIASFNRQAYERHRTEIAALLSEVRGTSGLGPALELLTAQQLDVGFVEDDLRSVKRYRVYDPGDRSRSFLIHYNPRRLQRQYGTGRADSVSGPERVHAGCFLCGENIRWQQRGIQVGFEIGLGECRYVCYCNPFPLAAVQLTVCSVEHAPQTWKVQAGGRVIRDVRDLLLLAADLPGYVSFFNGVGAGASIPHHFHYQVFKRAELEPYPLEQAPYQNKGVKGSGCLKNYPVAAAHFRGQINAVESEALRWFTGLERVIAAPESISANIIATRTGSDEEVDLYIVPRHRAYSYATGLDGLIAGLEVLGEIVLSTEADKRDLDEGRYTYLRSGRAATDEGTASGTSKRAFVSGCASRRREVHIHRTPRRHGRGASRWR
jgi:hypothetical protein